MAPSVAGRSVGAQPVPIRGPVAPIPRPMPAPPVPEARRPAESPQEGASAWVSLGVAVAALGGALLLLIVVVVYFVVLPNAQVR